MKRSDEFLSNDEKLIYSLRELYMKYGYLPYSMNKFEEYDLYMKNKEFLVSDNVISFTDTNGKLMALKPDVTLSIIKNTFDMEEGTTSKLSYDENVYRVTKGTGEFTEIMQAGLEAIGNVDSYTIGEVLKLSEKSLKMISNEYCLSISNLDILEKAIDYMNLSSEERNEVIGYIKNKNSFQIEAMAKRIGKTSESRYLLSLLSLKGSNKNTLSELKKISKELNVLDSYEIFKYTIGDLDKNNLEIDFSVVSDLNYYNGIVFNGFIKGIPERVLSGGEYDRLMKKLGRTESAIGFAIYLDTLQYSYKENEFDFDYEVVYDTDSKILRKIVKVLREKGYTVYASNKHQSKLKFYKIVEIKGEEVYGLE